MKRCPKCDRLFEENLLKFCRTDGTLLLSSLSDDVDTVILPVAPVAHPSKSDLSQTFSIAVIPFTNLTTDPANEYYCVGLADELVRAFSRIEKLQVTAPTSSFGFRGKGVSVPEIGRVLNIEAVLEGTIRRSKDEMRITVQLVSAQTGFQLWSERYERQTSDTFSLISEIALAVVNALDLPLSEAEQFAISKRQTENSTAHQLYLRGRFHLSRITAERLRAGVEDLKNAIAEDPNYAFAYAGLAEAYYLGTGVHQPPSESLTLVKEAAEKALELDENLAEAEALLAIVAANYERKPQEAERRIQRALKLAPHSLLAHRWYGCFLMTQGRLAAAIAELCRARELDPLSPNVSVLISHTYVFARQPHKALKHARRAMSLADNFWLAYWSAALAYEQLGQLVEALDQLEKTAERDTSPWILASRARVYAKLGRREVAELLLKELDEHASNRWVPPYLIATVYFALDDHDRAFEWLQKAYDQYDDTLNYLAVCPLMDPYRSDRRFIDLLRHTRLDQSNAMTHFVVPVYVDGLSSGRLFGSSSL